MNRIPMLVVLTAVMHLVCSARPAPAGVPQPDVVLYGAAFDGGQPIENNDNVTITARVNGVPDPIAVFHFQGEPGDCDRDRVPDNCELDCGADDGPCDVPGCGGGGDADGDNVPDSCQTGFYILRLRIESLADNAPQSSNAAKLGQIALIQFERPGATEQVASFPINAIGVLQRLDLHSCNRSADSDNDGDVDLVDYDAFQNCFIDSGNGPITPGCEHADLDCDNDVDVIDWGAFQIAFD